MSLIGPGVAGLPLFGQPAPEPVRATHAAFEDREASFLERVRRLVLGHYKGSECTADDAHRIMTRYQVEIPAGCSPNVMGTLFSGWDRASDTGRMIRSKRDGAGGNLIKVWRID